MTLYHFTLVVFTGLATFPQQSYGTGISTHIETAERAAEYLDLVSDGVDYKRLIRRYPGAFEAGQPYVDSYFPRFCQEGNLHYVSEDSHWTPFVDVAIKYIRRTYPKPWNTLNIALSTTESLIEAMHSMRSGFQQELAFLESVDNHMKVHSEYQQDTEKLVVFLLGIVEHHIADVKWHGQRTDQGFLVTMANVNYHGVFDDSHLHGDVGADVINQYSLNMDYINILPTIWHIPVDDLVNIYSDYYGDGRMTSEIIENCTLIMFLERLGENIGVLEFSYPFFSMNSPFLTERLQDYFQGGVDDMAVWTVNQWHEAVHMLDHGTNECYMPEEFLWARCSEISPTVQRRKLSKLETRMIAERRLHMKRQAFNEDRYNMNLGYLESGDVKTERTGRGLTLSLSNSLQKSINEAFSDEVVSAESVLNETGVNYPDFVYATELPYSRLGESLLTGDFNDDGFIDLVVGAPGHSSQNNFAQGRVYIVYGDVDGMTSSDLIIERDSDQIMDGPTVNARYGQSLAVIDYNKDGLPDLAVGAPSSGTETLEYQGAVYIHLGRGSPGIDPQPAVTIKCTSYFCNIGWSLSSGDVNEDGYDDLLIGAPYAPSGGEQRGFVGALFSRAQQTGGVTEKCPPVQPGSGTGACSSNCRYDSDCKVQHKCCKQTCGHACTNMGPTNPDTQITEKDLDWLVTGEQDYEWFGWSIAVSKPRSGSPSVIIGSPTYRLCAHPDCAYDPGNIQSVGKYTTYRAPLVASPESVVTGTEEMGQLGYSIAAGQIGALETLAVGATTINSTSLQNGEMVDLLRAGEVHVYSALAGPDPSYTLASDRQHARFGSEIKFFDVNNDGTNDFIVGAPHRPVNRRSGREAGHVFIFDGDTRSNQDAENAMWKLSLDETKSRFGTNIAAIRTSKTQVIVSAPHSNHVARLGGRVAVFNIP